MSKHDPQQVATLVPDSEDPDVLHVLVSKSSIAGVVDMVVGRVLTYALGVAVGTILVLELIR